MSSLLELIARRRRASASRRLGPPPSSRAPVAPRPPANGSSANGIAPSSAVADAVASGAVAAPAADASADAPESANGNGRGHDNGNGRATDWVAVPAPRPTEPEVVVDPAPPSVEDEHVTVEMAVTSLDEPPAPAPEPESELRPEPEPAPRPARLQRAAPRYESWLPSPEWLAPVHPASEPDLTAQVAPAPETTPIAEEPLVEAPIVEAPLVEAPLADSSLITETTRIAEPEESPRPLRPPAAPPAAAEPEPEPTAEQTAEQTAEPATRRQPMTGADLVSRSQMRRRAHYLRRLREVQLRDLGGFLLELHRYSRDRPDLVAAKLDSVAQTDRELRTLERALHDRVPLRELREPGIGGVCSACGAVHGSHDRFCATCGTSLGPRLVDYEELEARPEGGQPGSPPSR